MNDFNQINDLLLDDVKRHYAKREDSQIVKLGKVSDYKKEQDKVKDNNSFKERIINSLCVKIGVLLIIFGIIYIYPQFPDEIKNSKVIRWIKNEYKSNYSKESIVEKVEEYSKIIYSKVDKVIPENVYSCFVDKYLNYIKPIILGNKKYVDESLIIENSVAVFNSEDISINNTDNYIFAQSVATSSEISQMDLDIQEILSKNIKISCPVDGTVTSIYGAREEIFKNVGYHTGVDIANVLNTPIKSATDGVVVKTQQMDKYYGNNIEIENNGVIFKYAHLNQINVSEGDKITTGDIIGLMGSTGASTGSHLHFEIKINDRTVDPELLVSVR